MNIKILSFTFFASLLLLTNNYQFADQPKEKTIRLYIFQHCPFCLKVINHLKSINHINDVELVTVDTPEKRDELQKLSGGLQVPFLHDIEKNIKMLESADIIKHFSARFN